MTTDAIRDLKAMLGDALELIRAIDLIVVNSPSLDYDLLKVELLLDEYYGRND